MKKTYAFFLTAFFTATIGNILTAQIAAGSIPTGMYVYNPNVNLSVAACNMHDSTTFDINCDGTPDMAIDMYKGYTPIDGSSYASLYVLNDTIEICKDTVGNFSNYFGRPHYYNLGDTLNCSGNSKWVKDSIYTLGDCGAWLITGPQAKANVYIAYRKGSQIGWINISFNLIDGTVCSNPITLSITSVLTPCNSNAVGEIFSKDNIRLSPNPFSAQTVLQTATPLQNASLTICNSVGQTVKHVDNLSGATVLIQRDNLPSGLYFVRLTQDGNTISSDKFVITDK